MPIKSIISRFIKRRLNQWLERRIPPASQHQLSNRNIFIMPTRFGYFYLFFVVLLFLLATNYQNNVIMLLSYLMASLFITVMMHSFYNLSGITLSSDKKIAGYAKQSIKLPIIVSAPSQRLNLNLCFDEQQTYHLSKTVKGEQTVYVACHYEQRGLYHPGRLKLWSEYSLGLFIAWTRIDFDHQCVVYPEANTFKHSENAFTRSSKDNPLLENLTFENKPGTDDFFELKGHIIGEPFSRIAWKQFARGQGLLTKHYHQQQGAEIWLKLTEMPKHGLEKQLAYLCFLIKEYNHSGQIFGLDLGQHQDRINPSQGEQHSKQCLMALAIYPRSYI
jgi:uncharacterized protein (DUF58 family)